MMITVTPRMKITYLEDQPIKNTNKNKPPSLTIKEISLKETYTKTTKQEDNDETMETIYNK